MKKKNLNRRKFIQGSATAAVGVAAMTSCSSFTKLSSERNPSAYDVQVNESDKFDFIIVGSGAGGGPLACGLARNGFTVLLLEAGGTPSRSDDNSDTNRLSKTPVFNAKASDDALLNWSYFVDRYEKDGSGSAFEKLNSKFQQMTSSTPAGVYYPRASGLGGCTRVNALISLYPDHQDWDHIAKQTNDGTWKSGEMRRIYDGMQKQNDGWLNLSQASPLTLFKDRFLTEMAIAALQANGSLPYQGVAKEAYTKIVKERFNYELNPNHVGYVNNKGNGVFNIPFNATDGVRKGVREYIMETEAQYPKNLLIKKESLCTKVLFDGNNKTKVIGIEFIEGAHAYKADVLNQSQSKRSYMKKKAFAAKEVILASGAFSTPQLMMLSGLGPQAELERLKIPMVKNIPGVGKNLQDRYEVTVVSELHEPLSVLKDCTFAKDNNFDADPCWNEYKKDPKGHLYGTNGVALSLIRKSSSSQPTPDLAIFGLPGYFKGYYPGYSKDTTPKNSNDPSYFTWAILKGHTKNHAGEVKLRSTDPQDTPDINFKYFHDDGKGSAAEDLSAVLEGLKIARKINSTIGAKYFKPEIYPGITADNDAVLKSWIKREAWGHHASCTNKMGLASDPMAVVDSNFKVHGVQGLRIVDASVYPDIPGLFIMLPTLMISEKAKNAILQEYGKSQERYEYPEPRPDQAI
ncbi:MAG: GMC family oxidoreductase N-terminal domain-containing protein [Bdellovibrio sp.]|nr:GMC family oxidoreductase N-terminal domain-containing protein [Bdellovibrio sp.]